MNDFQIDLDIRARAIISERIGNREALMIWPDEERAYLGSAADYPAAAAALNCDIEDVDDELWDAYLDALQNEALQALKAETQQSQDVNDGTQRESWLHTWQGSDGWYYCFSGVNRDGLSSESDDVGPFDTRQDAIDTASAVLEEIANG